MKEKGRLSEELTVNFGIQISEIIAYLHKQKPVPVLYLDLKPQNIIIKNGRLYLVDFGNSMFLNSKRDYMSGTKGYAAPEQYEFGEIDTRADIYGIGALLYFMVTGLVCDGNVAFDTNISVSDTFKNIIIHCMSSKDERVCEALWVAENLSRINQEKFQKNEVIEYTGNSMEKPLVVYVTGAQRHIGVTHFALALAGRLNENGIKTIYEDKCGEVIKSIYEGSDNCRLSGGVYFYENIMMKYSYSDIVTLGERVNCKVVDCGNVDENESVDKYLSENADVVILIAGGKPWELTASKKWVKKLGREYKKGKLMVFWNFLEDKSSQNIPLFCNPFLRDADTNLFFDKVISKIFEEENVYKKEDRKRIFRFFTRKK